MLSVLIFMLTLTRFRFLCLVDAADVFLSPALPS